MEFHQRMTALSTVTDAGLVARCRAGDDDAWEELVRRFSRYVLAIAQQAYRLSPAETMDVIGPTPVASDWRRTSGAAWDLSGARNAVASKARTRIAAGTRRRRRRKGNAVMAANAHLGAVILAFAL